MPLKPLIIMSWPRIIRGAVVSHIHSTLTLLKRLLEGEEETGWLERFHWMGRNKGRMNTICGKVACGISSNKHTFTVYWGSVECMPAGYGSTSVCIHFTSLHTTWVPTKARNKLLHLWWDKDVKENTFTAFYPRGPMFKQSNRLFSCYN